MSSEQAWFKSYSVGTYVDTGLTSTGGVARDIAYTKKCTEWLNWNFDRQHGSPALMAALLDGPWDADKFLVLEPGQSARMTPDEHIVTAVGLPSGQSVVL